MKPKQFLPSFASRDAGMTLVEFMVAMGLSALIALMIVSVALANRTMYQRDIVRTRVNQNVRAALDLIGNEIRQAGERLPSSFPAIELIDNGADVSDQLILRRNLLDDALFGCEDIAASSTRSSVALSRVTPTGSACLYANQRGKMDAWVAYVSAPDASQKFYVFNSTTRAGEFMQLTGTPTTDTGTEIRFNILPLSPTNSYVSEATWLYILNQWSFGVSNEVLQIIENADTINPQNVVDQISNFQVQLLMNDGSTVDSLTAAGAWTNILAVRVSITGTQTTQGRTVSRTLSSDFFPRNVLST